MSGVWLDLAKALCLMIVLEGVMPFLSPRRWRYVAAMLSQIDDRTMRLMGFVSMLIGAGLLFLIS